MTPKRILPGQTIGVLGGGQLGRMMAIAARQMGYRIAVLEPKKDSPCGQVADHEVIANYDDAEGAKELAQLSDVITYEFENVDLQTAAWLQEQAYLPQGRRLLEVTQDREFEKKAITESGVDVAPYRIVHTEEDFKQALRDIGFPSVLKTCRGGYDGKGQMVLDGRQDAEQASAGFVGRHKAILEQQVPFAMELSVIVSRSVAGEVKTFPVAQNLHHDNILQQTRVPANISGEITQNATAIALKVADALDLVGTLAVEMFLRDDGTIFVNELAPRPHNSGHFTIDACETSQFEQHIRAICGWPLADTTLLKPAVMTNMLGEDVSASLSAIDQYADVKYHLYGKDAPKPKRKMGHVTVLGDTIEQALAKAENLPFGKEVVK